MGGDGHHLTLDGRSFFFRGGAGCRSSLVQVRGGLTPERGRGGAGDLPEQGPSWGCCGTQVTVKKPLNK